jgi:hypothetical protein
VTSEFEKTGHSAHAKNLLVSFFVGYADVSGKIQIQVYYSVLSSTGIHDACPGAFEPSQTKPRTANLSPPPLVTNSNCNTEEENPVVQSVLPDLSDLASNIMGLAPKSDPPRRYVVASDLVRTRLHTHWVLLLFRPLLALGVCCFHAVRIRHSVRRLRAVRNASHRLPPSAAVAVASEGGRCRASALHSTAMTVGCGRRRGRTAPGP